MSTKKDLEEKVMKLRDLLLKAEEKIKDLTAEKEAANLNYNNKAVGAFYDKNKMEWSLVEIEYDIENGVGRVSNIRNLGREYAMVEYRTREFLAEKILLPVLRRKV